MHPVVNRSILTIQSTYIWYDKLPSITSGGNEHKHEERIPNSSLEDKVDHKDHCIIPSRLTNQLYRRVCYKITNKINLIKLTCAFKLITS